MRIERREFLTGVLSLAVVLGHACSALAAEPSAPRGNQPNSTPPKASIDHYRLTGPYAHKNLAIYLLHSDQRDDREFLTLNEGLKSGLVRVSELDNEQVNRLRIENRSDKPLFLQEGDRVTGGKQDRTIYSSLVVAAKSGPQQIPSFCIEPSRWSGGEAFGANPNAGYASNSVRQAAKLAMNQGAVWNQVGLTKRRLAQILGTKNTNTSLNEAIDSQKIIETTKGYKAALGKLCVKHKDAVGFAFAVNGKILEVNAFPGNPLAATIYPRLLETYAVDAVTAATLDKQHASAKAPAKEKVLALMKTRVKNKAERREDVNQGNQLVIFAEDQADPEAKTCAFRCQTHYQGKLVHLQWIKAEKMSLQGGRQQLLNPAININDAPNQNPIDSSQQQREVPQQQRQ